MRRDQTQFEKSKERRRIQLPVLNPPISHQRYSCDECGTCCRDFVVELDSEDLRRLRSQDWTDQLTAEPWIEREGSAYLNKLPDGACIFLDEHNRCRIHARYGLRAKPLTCQLYPFTIVPCADGEPRIALRFDCHSIATSQGEPIESSTAHVRPLVQRIRGLADLPRERIWWRAGIVAEHAQVDQLIEACDSLLTRDIPWSSKWRALVVATESVCNSAVVDAHQGDVESAIRVSFATACDQHSNRLKEPPSAPRRAQANLRGLVFALGDYTSFARHIHLARERRGTRWLSRARAAFAFRLGRGVIPRLHRMPADIRFDTIESVRPASGTSAAAIEEMLTRWFRTRLLSRLWFGRACYGWPIGLGLRATWTMAPIAGWIARWCAAGAGRTAIDLEDVVRAIGTVDHGLQMLPPVRQIAVARRITSLHSGDAALALYRMFAMTVPRDA